MRCVEHPESVLRLGKSDMSKLDLIAPDSPEAALSRRSLVQTIAGTALAMTFLAGCGGSDDDDDNGGNNGGSGNSSLDIAILQFALNLEYLEAEFYSYSTTGQGIGSRVELTGIGTQGATTGGVQTNFTSTGTAQYAAEIANDEITHVQFLRGQLGNNVIAKPAININPLGLDLSTEQGYLTLARAFEDVGVTAYNGAAAAISNKGYLSAAAAILAVEAYHAGILRLQNVQQGVPAGAPLDSKDQPPTTTNLVPTNASSLAFGRTPREVLRIVYASPTATTPVPGGFFPAGANLGTGNAQRLLDLG